MPSPLFRRKNKFTFDLWTLRDVPAGIPVLFAVLAFLVGYGGSTYSHRVSNLFANRGVGVYCLQNCNGAYESWYRNNQEATGRAQLIPAILMFGFPIAMTMATFLAMSLAWLPHVRIGRLLPGLGLLYCGSVATAVLAVLSLSFGMSAFFFPVALALGLCTLAVYLYVPVLARAILAGRDPSIRGESGAIFLAMSASIPLGLVVGEILHWLFPTFIMTYGIQVAMGWLFGASLALPGVPQQPVPVANSNLPAGLQSSAVRTIERLVLALGAQIAVSAITLFQRASRPLMPLASGSDLLVSFILTQLPFVILICLLLKRPGRSVFTFLTAMLGFGIVETFFDPMVVASYRRIYLGHPIGLIWPAFSGMIYMITGVLTYTVIQKTALKPKLWSAILGTAGMFCYFFLIKQVTPHFNGLWR